MHWIRAHVGHTNKERADVLAKGATNRHLVDVEVKVTRRQVKKHLVDRGLSPGKRCGASSSETGRMMYEIVPRITLRRQQGDF